MIGGFAVTRRRAGDAASALEGELALLIPPLYAGAMAWPRVNVTRGSITDLSMDGDPIYATGYSVAARLSAWDVLPHFLRALRAGGHRGAPAHHQSQQPTEVLRLSGLCATPHCAGWCYGHIWLKRWPWRRETLWTGLFLHEGTPVGRYVAWPALGALRPTA